MNLQLIKNAATSKMGRQILTVQKHSPAILFGAGVAGIIATVVLASRATLKLHDVIDDAETDLKAISGYEPMDSEDYTDRDRQKDTAIVYAKTAAQITRMYLPAIALGTISIVALTGSHIILTRRNVALTAAYAALDKGWRQYRERVVAELGEDKDREFRYGSETRDVVEETDKGPKIVSVTRVGDDEPSIYAKWFDDSCSAWQRQPEYNRLFLQCQQNYANDLLKAKGWITLNEVYEMLGMKKSQAGMIVGWVKDGPGDGFIDFGIFNGNSHDTRDFVNGWQDRVLIDFNVDGVIFDMIGKRRG